MPLRHVPQEHDTDLLTIHPRGQLHIAGKVGQLTRQTQQDIAWQRKAETLYIAMVHISVPTRLSQVPIPQL